MKWPAPLAAVVCGLAIAEAQLGFAPLAVLGFAAYGAALRGQPPLSGLLLTFIAVGAESTMFWSFAHVSPLYFVGAAVLHLLWRLPFTLVWIRNRDTVWGPLSAAVGFGALEWLRSTVGPAPILLGDAFAHYPELIRVAGLGGSPVVGFVVVGAGLALSTAPDVRQWSLRMGLGLSPLLLTLIYGLFSGAPPVQTQIRVGIVQGNVPHWTYQLAQTDPAVAGLIRDVYIEPSSKLAKAVDLVIWPETAVPQGHAKMAALQALRERSPNTSWLLGLPEPRQGGGEQNAALVFGAGDSTPQVYAKRRLVPGYEAGFIPGGTPSLLDVGSVKIAPLICWENLFGSLAASADTADLLVVLSDDGAFVDPYQAESHARRTVLRAVERARPAVHAGQVGPSFVVDAQGKIKAYLPAYTQGVLKAELGLPAASGTTFYARYPWLFGLCCLLLSGASLFRRS